MNNDWLYRISPCVRTAGYHQRQHLWSEPARVIYDHELVLFTAGRCRVEMPGRIIDCQAPAFLIMPPGRLHVTRVVGEQPVRRYWVHFDWTYIPGGDLPLASYRPEVPDPRQYRPAPSFVARGIQYGPVAEPGQLEELLLQLCNLWATGYAAERLTCRAILLDALIRLLARGRREEIAPRRQHRLLHDIGQVLEDLAAQPMNKCGSVREALEQVGYSYEHLCRLYKQHLGVAPLEYVNTLRIERAKYLLRVSRLSVSQVARQLGFDHPCYFSRLFRQYARTSPRQYAAGES